MRGGGNGVVKIFHSECSKSFFRFQDTAQLDGEGDVGPEEAISTREWAEQKHCSSGSGAGDNCLIRTPSEVGVPGNEDNRASNTSSRTRDRSSNNKEGGESL